MDAKSLTRRVGLTLLLAFAALSGSAQAAPVWQRLSDFSTTTEAGKFADPTGIGLRTAASGAVLSVLVANSDGGSVTELAPDGQSAYGFVKADTSRCFDAPWSEPWDVAVDPATGDAYITDASRSRISRIDSAGRVGSELSWGCYPGPWMTGQGPHGLVVSAGSLLVTSPLTYVDRVPLGFSGTFDAWPFGRSEPYASNAYDVAVDPTTGISYVAQTTTRRIATYDATGRAIGTIGAGSFGSKGPEGVAIDPEAKLLFASDTAGDQVIVLNALTGAEVTRLTGLKTPVGVAVDPVARILYVANKGADGVARFSYAEEPTPPPPPAPPAPPAVVVHATEASLTLPACTAQQLTTAYEKALKIKLVCATNTGVVSQYRITQAPENGKLKGLDASGNVTYTPDSLFIGSETFTFDAVGSDGVASTAATVTIQVGTALPEAELGKSANLFHSRGENYFTLPGSTRRIRLRGGVQVPVGSVIDARNGRVGMFVKRGQTTRGGDFASGRFKVTQNADGTTKLELLGDAVTRSCAIHEKSYSGSFDVKAHWSDDPNALTDVAETVSNKLVVKGATTAAAKKRATKKEGKPSRRLWGRDHKGKFVTVAHGSSASVLGTGWMTYDYPDGTLTFVLSGSVSVHDYGAKKTVRVTKGHYYFAATGDLPLCK